MEVLTPLCKPRKGVCTLNGFVHGKERRRRSRRAPAVPRTRAPAAHSGTPGTTELDRR
jgi:hypothetical protein